MARGKENKEAKHNVWRFRPVYTEERVKELTQSLKDWVLEAVDNDEKFLFTRWAFSVGLTPGKAKYIADIDGEFADVYEVAKAWQEFRLQEDTLYRKAEYRMAMAMLVHNHGWRVNGDDDVMKRLDNEFGRYLDAQKQAYDKKKEDEEAEEE